MRVLKGIQGLLQAPKLSAMTVGNFDGAHRGHQSLLDICRQRRSEGAMAVVVVTFEPHPLTVLRPVAAPPRLTSAARKQALIEEHGADYYVVLAPEPPVLNLTAEDFWKILRDDVRPMFLVEGEKFTFGKNAAGDVHKLAKWAADSQVQFELIAPVTVPMLNLALVAPSSSLIRWLLARGRARDAAICLGRPFALEGRVVKGQGRGKSLGVPTANLDCGEQFIPAQAVYAGRCRIGMNVYPAAISIGANPTFGDKSVQVEVHLVGAEADLYGEDMVVEVTDWLRDQKKFASGEALSAQMKLDIDETISRAEMRPEMPIAAATISGR
jgi:riboflavin kinase / FMN adenylyltransferase